jgi:hypothetical protein
LAGEKPFQVARGRRLQHLQQRTPAAGTRVRRPPVEKKGKKRRAPTEQDAAWFIFIFLSGNQNEGTTKL